MIYSFHPEAAAEYAEHVAFYKSLRTELGARFHEAVKTVIASICEMPARHHTEVPPDIRRARVQGFPFHVIFREVDGNIQILALAHHRRRPLYWISRL
ncbi:type II toxin-antitoxin system RelE/ParE family toxin [Methylomicrobium lacus]|uniref:type II toxin-antitoxin system RelE/ParE family toxin n=1 Tax=Methylomicrobium lacus TaxID=136992 RepID=UPI00045E69A8|nr:type II toxin-antitoxin system RelE/ParE family toxin [Methylomicrobium lacus]